MEINLLPQSTIVERYSNSMLIVTCAVCLAAVACFGALGLSARQGTRENRAQLAAMESRALAIQQQLHSVNGVPQSSLYGQTDVAKVLQQIKDAAPVGIEIQQVTWQSNTVQISGAASSLVALSAFVSALQHMPGCRYAWVTNTGGGQNGYSFALNVSWGGGGS
jgi:Tfp pilus assembly protein PilN